MLNAYFKQTGIYDDNRMWAVQYIPGAGFTYRENGSGASYRIVKGNSKNEYRVQGNYVGNKWEEPKPVLKQYKIETPEGFRENIVDNTQELRESLGYNRANEKNLKFNRLEDVVANVFKKEEE